MTEKARKRFILRNSIGPALAGLILLVAFLLRARGITAQSFSFDEGWTSWAISLGWGEMFELLARDNHPPLYFLLLRGWAAAFGQSDLALRSFSLVADLGTVVLVYLLGKKLWNEEVGLLAMAIAAFSPPLIMYAQEARMYSLTTCLVAAATYLLINLWQEGWPERRRWAYWLVMAAALYTHHFAWLAFGAHLAIAFLWGVSHEKSAVAGLKAALNLAAGVLLLYLPCLPLTLIQIRVARSFSWRPHTPIRSVLKDLWLFLNFGTARGKQVFSPLTWGAWALAAAGLGLGWRKGRTGWSLICPGLIVPIVGMCLVQKLAPIYTDRYMLFLASFYYLLLALGAWTAIEPVVKRRVTALATGYVVLAAGLLLPMLLQLDVYWRGEGPLKPDFRAVAAHIEKVAHPGDSLALVQSGPAFLHYYRGDLPWEVFPGISVEDYVSSEEKVADKLRRIARPGKVVWLVQHALPIVDPQNLVEGQLREHGTYWDEQWWPDSEDRKNQEPIRVAAYVIKDTNFGPEPRIPIGANFGGELELVGYHIQRDRERIYVILWWKALARPKRHYNAFVHLIDRRGQFIKDQNGHEIQGDRVPGSPYRSMGNWKTGQIFRDEHVLEIKGVDLREACLRVGLSWGKEGEHQLKIVSGRWDGQSYIIVPVRGDEYVRD